MNNDNLVKASDARFVLRASAGLETPSSFQMILGDVDGDGLIKAADARAIERVAAALDVRFITDIVK